MSFRFKPLSNYIVVEVVKEKQRGKLILPDIADRKNIACIVVAISEEKDSDGNPFVKNVKVGDDIYFDMHQTTGIIIDEKQYVTIRESAVFGILPPKTQEQIEDEIIAKNTGIIVN